MRELLGSKIIEGVKGTSFNKSLPFVLNPVNQKGVSDSTLLSFDSNHPLFHEHAKKLCFESTQQFNRKYGTSFETSFANAASNTKIIIREK
ncbi:MAG: hypothetical protein ABH803_02690 [Candidatus Micrarchaeota archaeon]